MRIKGEGPALVFPRCTDDHECGLKEEVTCTHSFLWQRASGTERVDELVHPPTVLSFLFQRWIASEKPRGQSSYVRETKAERPRVLSLTLGTGLSFRQWWGDARWWEWKCFADCELLCTPDGCLLYQLQGIILSSFQSLTHMWELRNIEKRAQMCIKDIFHPPRVWKCLPQERQPAPLI